MKPRSLLAAAVIGLFMLQPVSNLAEAAANKAARASVKPAPKKPVAKAAVQKKKAAARPSARKAVKNAKAKPAAKNTRRVSVRMAPAAAGVAAAAVAPAMAESDVALTLDANGLPQLGSSAFYIVNPANGEVLLERNASTVVPIASITKLMTAMVVLDAGQGLSEPISVANADIDTLKGTGSRLAIGTTLTREEMLHLALMSSENRAASALARHYPGGEAAFIEAMNVKARLLGLWNTRFHDSTGLNPANVSSPRDLAKMVSASASYPLIREFSTSPERYVDVRGRMTRFGNTNGLVKSPEWSISVSKTGYISEAGRCLVMQAWLHQQPVVMVLMDSNGRYTRTADAKRVRKWLEQVETPRIATAPIRREG
ncbi:serine hydrolase [Thauera linaloolentis]|uniref:Peptidase S11 D-alanyl-D-alanine carboxypeptidase 1 n=1 Tax=Thauera linaloolentis (strain DSM 12138 / JCM 21573 / CCUG 41526 / CIP 105981 / IAM 15112 / NBRC 102519 / 47Lol) TaxID=1123367 RepID=N6Z7L2_THAL4|nr:serine hydrolase [Thauera linaloolentis]ENO90572.1 peptidase S11 D-alanyl-D-alanine carboxypeptidase 1 [Thauera linaloolentis 47Lol = DSM 12138]MCM8566078.1 serine hydrolase [Thauera linaloolentis]